MSSTQHQLIEQCATRLRGIVEALDNIHDSTPHRWSTDLDDVHSSAESLLALINDQAPPSEDQLIAAGLSYPLAKEDAVKLWYSGFRSEVITVLEAWEAIGHDTGINPDKEELLESLRNMAAICNAHGNDMPAQSAIDQRQVIADAITGALAFGAQASQPPAADHWLRPFYDIGRAEGQRTQELAMLVRMLASSLKRHAPESNLVARATNYLAAKGLAGTPLRDPPAPVEQAGGDERAAFFKHLIGRHPAHETEIVRVVEHNYAAWKAWRARAALARVEQQERTIAGINEAHAKLAGLYEAAQAQHSAGYAEARQCVNCRHIGINDAADYAACHDCRWTGPEPDEDKCPGCAGENCMAAACPECGGRYELVAEAKISTPAAQAGQMPQAWLDVQAERRRQITAEGWTPEHDDEHSHGQIARAAACYALAGSSAPNDGTAALLVSLAWPWDQQWWKPTSARRDLIKAGALILAEIERLDRAAPGKEVGHE
ncbi:TPA: hypothetical protein ACKPG4_000160 [Pseudomonas aeruginosa]|uniref:hypothetical protein n=1 Tax=Pseudomonas aeruginosa TaxID=287 RepID=UPI000F533318|nr:hypothetical protein [Pseudomonas aeruginosa]RPO42120.1 hypothetical protein IPC1191_18090 [Pseudomonas aeruginosa]RPO52139.1 hypothetical protein IPC1190_19285 [Pseudomonas aeruginosa]